MAKPNYGHQKRQKEIEKKRKQEEKRRKKQGTTVPDPQSKPADGGKPE